MSRFRQRILHKLYGGFAILVLLHTLIVGVPLLRFIERETEKEIGESLMRSARLLEHVALPALEDESKSVELEALLHSLGEKMGQRFTVIDKDGKVLAESEATAATMENHAHRPEIIEAREAGVGRSVRFSTTIERDMSYVALRVGQGERMLGFVRVGIPRDDIGRRKSDVMKTMSLGAFAAVVIALLLGYYAARRMTSPLVRMTAAAEQLAGGGLAPDLQVDSRDEIGDLSRALSTMAERLGERMDMLGAERNKLIAVLGGMVEGVVAVDVHESVLFANEAARRILGTPPAGWSQQPLLQGCRVPAIIETLRSALRETRDVSTEVALPGENNREQVLQVHASPLRGGSGEGAGAVLVLHDVTELRRLEKVRREFVANVSHELKTPLAAMRGLVDTMHDDESMDPATRQRFLGKTQAQITRLTAIVSDLLTLSKIESTRRETLDLHPVDLCRIARESLERIESAARQKMLELRVEIPPQPLRVMGEERLVGEILDNLLDNAIKYTPSEGHLLLRATEENQNCRIEVEDSGIGIEPREIHRIFERFYRVDKARSREAGGTGLGLSIVKHIVDLLGGEIVVESTPGRGSTFIVRLPRAIEPQPLSPQPG